MRRITMWLLPRYANRTLPGWLSAWMRRQLDTDAALAQAYDLLRRAEHSAAGSDDFSNDQLELMLGSIFDHLDTYEPTASTSAAAAGFRWLQTGVPGALAAACAVVFFVVGHSGDGPARVLPSAGTGLGGLGEVQARSALGDQPVGVRVRCVSDGAVTADVVAGLRQSGGTMQCPSDGLLAFSTTNLSARSRYVFVVGISDDGEPTFVPPFSQRSEARLVAPGQLDILLDELAPMGAVTAAGTSIATTLHVIFGDAPFSGVDVARRLDGAARSAVPLQQLTRLPVDIDDQAHLTVYATGGRQP
jgi:hypothetical protein